MTTFPLWLDALCSLTLVLGALCAGTVLVDVLRRPQKMGVMNIVWPVCALFGTLFTLWLYFRYGRAQAVQSQPSSRWQPPAPPYAVSVATGTLHCGSGCMLGDVFAEWLAFFVPSAAIAFGWHSLFDEKTYAVWVLDFIAAFVLGIAFQYFAIKPMRHLSVCQGLLAALKADALSLLAWQCGMYCLMAVLQIVVFARHFGRQAPVDSVEFWAAMQVAMVAGFATSYPMNWWLVRAGLKESM